MWKRMWNAFQSFDDEQKAGLELEQKLLAQFKRDRILRDRIKEYIRTSVVRKRTVAS